MIKIHCTKIILPVILIFHCFKTFSQRNDVNNYPTFFYIDNEVDGSNVHYKISKNPLDSSLNMVFRKFGVIHVKDVIKTVMIYDYIKIILIELHLKSNPQKSYWEVNIEYFYNLPREKEKKHGRQYIGKWLGYNFVFINALTGKIKRKKFKQTSIVCY